MKLLKATMFNMDKPNKNNRYYSREAIDNGSNKFCEGYLYLYDRMPTNKENTLPLENIIGMCLETYWSNNDSQLYLFHVQPSCCNPDYCTSNALFSLTCRQYHHT